MELVAMLVGLCSFVAEYTQILFIIRQVIAFFTLLTPIILSILYLPYLLLNKHSFSGLEWLYLLTIVAPWSLFASATVFASATAHIGAKTLPLNHLLLRTLTTWKSPLSATALAAFIYFYPFNYVILNGSPLVLALDLLFDQNRDAIAFNAINVFVVAVAVLCLPYMSFFGMMGFVVSVVEGKGGWKAMKKGGELVKGTGVLMKGVVLNFVFAMVAMMVYAGMRMVMMNTSEHAIRVAVGLILLSSFWVAGLFVMVACTILYVKCKMIRGEEIEVMRNLGCGEEAIVPLITPDLA